LAFQNGFPVFEETIIKNYRRCDKQILLARSLRSRRLDLDFRFADVSNRGIGSIEWSIGKRFRGRAEQSNGKHRQQ
jgi:hypothetical protein